MTDYASLIDAEEPKEPAPADTYGAVIDAEDGDRSTRRRQNVLGALDTNPEQYALARQIERHLQIPAPVADRNFAEAQRKFKITQMDHLLRDNPTLARQMEDPEFAKLSADHAQQLADILDGVGTLKASKGPEASFGSVMSGLLSGFVQASVRARESVRMQFADFLGLDDMSADAQRKTMQSNARDALTTPEFESSTAKGLYSGGVSLLRQIPGLAASIALRNPTPALAAAGIQTEAESYGKYRTRGATKGEALLGATTEGAIEVATELLPMKFLAERIGRAGVGQFLTGFLAREMPTEQLATFLQDATDTAVANPDKTWQQFLEERPDAAYQTLLATLVQSGAIGALHTAARAVAKKDGVIDSEAGNAHRATLATQREEMLQGLIDSATAAPLRERAPDVFARALNDAAAEGQDISEIHINARQLATVFNQDPIRAAETLGIDAETLDAALASGGDVTVPVGEFVTALATDEAMRPLIEHAKLGVGEMSAAEAREWEKQQGEAFRQEAEQILTRQQHESAFAQSAQQVEDFVFDELQKAGRYTESVNRADAALHKAFAVTMADRLGMTPMDFFKQHVLRVTGEPVVGGFEQPSNDDVLALFAAADNIELTDVTLSEEQINEAERAFLSHFPEGVATYRRTSGIARRIRRASDAAANDIREDPAEPRIVDFPLGPFSGFRAEGVILPGDDAYNPGGVLKVKIYGKEQVEAGLLEEAALTFTVMQDGELSVNGPTPGGKTFEEFQKRGWAEQSKAGDQIAEGWSNLVAPDGGKMPIGTVIGLLADVHARVRAWKLEDRTGLHWARATGALAALGDYGSAIYLQPAYHGSPYRFDKFSLDHIGNGEGAQAYGWGLYFAGAREVAEFYRDNLSSRQGADPTSKRFGGKTIMQWYDYWQDQSYKSKEPAAIYDRMMLLERVEISWNAHDALRYAKEVGSRPEAVEWFEKTIASKFDRPGATYEVDIPEDGEMLLWDRPLSDQPEKVRAALGALGIRYDKGFAWDQGSSSDWYTLNANVRIEERRDGFHLFIDQNDVGHYPALEDAKAAANEKAELTGEEIYSALRRDHGGPEAASKFLNSLGVKGIKYLDGSSRSAGDGSYNYVIFDDQAVQILNAYYQAKGEQNRGSFNPATNTIALLQKADLSTFLHESGHYFLEVMADVATQPDAPVQLRQDFDALLAWFGVQGGPNASASDTWALMSLEEKRQYHEQFARGFEAYLFEGKAPSLELQGLFARFRAWLINVYRSLSQLDVTLTDEVRGVMDRMLATDEQIATAEAARRFAPIFQTAEQAGMTAEEWAAYQAEHQQATDDAAADLEARSVRDMRWLANAKSKRLKELQKTATALRAEVEIEVRAEVMTQPVYQVWQFLTGKPEKAKAKPKRDPKVLDPTTDSLFVAIAKLGGIDKLEIVQTWGTDPADIKALPRPVFGMPIVRTNDGRSIDDLAQRLGEYGYLPTDEHGKVDARDLEDAFAAELRGDAQYSAQHDYVEYQPEPGHFDLENYPHGKLEASTVRVFYGSGNEIVAQLDALGMLAEEGYQPDEVADFFGFTSGDEMMRALAEAEPPAAVIEAGTDLRMLEQFGDLSSPEAIERAAEKAIHNDVRARFLTRELNALRKATGKANVLLKAARDYAEQRIAGLKVKDAIKSAPHRAAEARAGKAADQALKAGDTAAAATHKRDQVLNHELARASIKAQDEVQAIIGYLKRFDKDTTRKAIDADYRDQIDALLERFDLRKGVSEKQLAKRKSLADWIEKQTAMGIDPVVDQRLLDDMRLRHYRDATLEELRGLRDTVAGIEHLGRLKNQLLTAQKNRNLQAVAAEIATSIFEHGKGRKPSAEPIGDPQGIQIVARWGKQFAAMHRKFASIARQLDGFKDGGPMWEYFVRSMNDAGNREADLRARMSEKLAALFDGIKHVSLTRKEQVLPGVSLTRENMLVMALNWGNEGNRQRLMDGGLNDTTKRLTQGQVEGILDRLTKEEWDFVQGVWDLLETNRPAIAEQERRLTGVEPKWVEPAAIVTRHGTYRGGYYPAKYDGNFSTRSNELEALTDLRQQMQGAANRAQTRKGYTQARAEEVTGRPLKLAVSTLTQHVNEVAHRLAWQDWLIDTNRLLKRNEIDAAIREHYGPHLLAEIRDTVRDIAVGDVAASTALERGLNHLRTGATIAGLGWNVTTSLLQPLGLSQSVVRIGWAPVARGLRTFAAHPLRTIEDVEAKSKFMQHRGATINREINDVLNRVRNDKASRIEASFFYLIQALQKVADMPTWLGRYEQALAAGETESRAVALADQAVIDAQGAGQLKDLAKIQRGSPALKLFTNFYSYFNTTYNLAVERGRATDYHNPLAVGRLAVDYLMLFTVPAVLGTLMKHVLRGGDDDEDKIMEKLAREQLNYLFGTMVLLREVGGAFTGNFGYEGPAGLRAFSALQKLVKQAEQGEVDKELVKAAVNVAGVVGVPGIGQFPAGQVNRTIDGVVAVAEGKAGPRAVVFGPPPKN